MGRVALVDVNNFYVSCERVFNPGLVGKPVVVLSNNDGCAISRSNEAKALGVKMAQPWFQCQELAEKHGIVALSSNYTLYADMSNRVMSIFARFSPSREVYSIDECFLDFEHLDRATASACGQAMRAQVQKSTGLPVSVGIASSKTLAKLANHVAKKGPEWNGVCDFDTLDPAAQDELLSRLSVIEVWGVGRRISEKLEKIGIATVGQLRDADAETLRRRFSVVLERTIRELRGISCLTLESLAPAKRQIMCSRSFGTGVIDLDELQQSVATYVSRAAEKLRRQHSTAAAVHVFCHTNPFRREQAQYAPAITVPLTQATDDTLRLAQAARYGLARIYRSGYRYVKAGVMLMQLAPSAARQTTLFEHPAKIARRKRLMGTVDALNHQWGPDTIALAAGGIHRKWAIKQEAKSPHYTTDWDQLPIVHA